MRSVCVACEEGYALHVDGKQCIPLAVAEYVYSPIIGVELDEPDPKLGEDRPSPRAGVSPKDSLYSSGSSEPNGALPRDTMAESSWFRCADPPAEPNQTIWKLYSLEEALDPANLFGPPRTATKRLCEDFPHSSTCPSGQLPLNTSKYRNSASSPRSNDSTGVGRETEPPDVYCILGWSRAENYQHISNCWEATENDTLRCSVCMEHFVPSGNGDACISVATWPVLFWSLISLSILLAECVLLALCARYLKHRCQEAVQKKEKGGNTRKSIDAGDNCVPRGFHNFELTLDQMFPWGVYQGMDKNGDALAALAASHDGHHRAQAASMCGKTATRPGLRRGKKTHSRDATKK